MLPLPDWLDRMPAGFEKMVQINRFYMRVAALYASQDGSLAEFAFVLRINYSTLASQANGKVFASRNTRAQIGRLLGEEFVPPTKAQMRERFTAEQSTDNPQPRQIPTVMKCLDTSQPTGNAS